MNPHVQEAVDWEVLAERIQGNDEDAVAHFATEFGLRLRRFYILGGLTPSDAEELAVDTLGDIALGVQQNRFKAVGPGSFVGWCYTVARHRLADQFRSRREAALSASDSIAAPAAADRDSASALHQTVRKTLDSMAEQHREILLLRHSSLGGTFGEIAKMLGISEEAARRRYHRARNRLEKELRSIPSLREWLEKTKGQTNPVPRKGDRS